MDDATISLLSAAIGAMTVVTGLFIKEYIDHRRIRRRQAREDAALFLEERKAVYDRFLQLSKNEYVDSKWLRKLALIVRDGGEEPSVAELSAAPPSPMKELIESQDEIMRIARSYQVVIAARNIVQLFGDMATANRRMLEAVALPDGSRVTLDKNDKMNDDILWFVLCRLLEDRQREFIHAYRTDLGLGSPSGAPESFPIAKRPWPPEVPESILRRHILPVHLKTRQNNGGGQTAK